MKYTLTLSPDYVLDWGFWEACRELLQNSIDQHRVKVDCKPIFQHDAASNTLTIGTTNCHLEPRTLLLGMTNKRDDDNLIGQFGEGYKLALLVLTRLQYEVVIYNGDTIWRPSFEFSELYKEHLLTIDISPNPSPCNGVSYRIRDVSAEEFGNIHERYLMDEPTDKIYTEEYMKGRVFVSGLFVCDVEGLEFGYNFSPGRIRLDRDRGMASSFEVAYASSQLWENSGNDAQLYDNLAGDILDTQHVSFSVPTVNEYVVNRYLKEHGEAIPVASQEELDRHRGCKMQLVSKPLRDLLRRMHAFVFNREGSPSERIENFARHFKKQLDTEGKRELDAMLEDSKGWS